MAKNPAQLRKHRYYKLSSALAQIDNAGLHTLFRESEASTGWGRNLTIEVGGSRVFIKRVPVTGIEYDNLFSTKNLYSLPTYYNYGVGSAGLGVFRELVANIKTTNWVLDGEIETFPLLYHYRVIPFSGEREAVDRQRNQGYVDYWGGDENIGRYMLDRASANHELVLFLEHIPHVLHPWLLKNPGSIAAVLDDLRATVDFLRKNGIIHFDAHFHNVLTDGKRPYLADFGLVLDKRFTLSDDEVLFFKAHTHYDYGEILSCLGYVLYSAYESLPDSEQHQLKKKYSVEEGVQGHEWMHILLDKIEEMHAEGILKLDERDVACMVRYRGIIALMRNFYANLSRNNQKDTKYPGVELLQRLKQTGFHQGGAARSNAV